MKIRLGYVSLSKAFDSSFRTITYTQFKKENEDFKHLHEIILYNLHTLLEILKYNDKNNIHFYRMTSNLIPLATHKDVSFDYITPYRELYQKIGKFIKEKKMRCDMHPDQYVVLNSTNKDIIENSKNILLYHARILEAMEIENPALILHVGSSVLGKKNAMTRFTHTFLSLPDNIQKMILIENDDKTFSVNDVLALCKRIEAPMVLDYHHYICHKDDVEIEEYYKGIFDTWKGQTPKIHFSSPKNKTKKEMRSHHDYIDIDSFISFLESIKHLPYDLDIMVEAKAKDDALFRLVRQLKYKTNYPFIDDTSFYVTKKEP